ncbi:MAG: TetR/AcrR family transcriptional regulator, partial [Pseudomonadota bacterium]
WGNYIPVIYGMAKALLSMKDDDDAASDAWRDRMAAVRHGCEAAVNALATDGQLTENYNKDQCVDILWTLLSVRNWEHLTQDCGWTQKSYIEFAKSSARKLLL